jgi:hypothetical protein
VVIDTVALADTKTALSSTTDCAVAAVTESPDTAVETAKTAAKMLPPRDFIFMVRIPPTGNSDESDFKYFMK